MDNSETLPLLKYIRADSAMSELSVDRPCNDSRFTRSFIPFAFAPVLETMSIPCDAGCPRRFNTISSMHKHLVASKTCGGYLEGKLRDLGLFDEDVETSDFVPQADLDLEADDSDEEEVPYEPFIFEPPNAYVNELHFIPPDGVNEGDQNAIAGPGPSTAANITSSAVDGSEGSGVKINRSTKMFSLAVLLDRLIEFRGYVVGLFRYVAGFLSYIAGLFVPSLLRKIARVLINSRYKRTCFIVLRIRTIYHIPQGVSL